MSTNVLVIPEDFRKDQYVLKPILTKLMERVVSKPRVRVCQEPLLGGIDQAMNKERLAEIIDRYRGMIQVFLLVVDRDGKAGRRKGLDALEAFAAKRLHDTPWCFVAAQAWQEVEVWVLAGMKDLPKTWNWSDLRDERDPKELYYDPYAESRGLHSAPYEGRQTLAREAASNYDRIRKLSPEVAELEKRIADALSGS